MDTSSSQYAACRLVGDSALKLETEASREPDYYGIVVTEDTLLVIYRDYMNLQLYRRRDGKLLYTSHRLESTPTGVSLISKTEIAVCLWNSTIVFMTFKSIDDVKLVRTLNVITGFCGCRSVAKLNSEKLVVSGVKRDGMLYWCVVSLTTGCVDSTHKVCQGGIISTSHLAITNDTVYISCRAKNSTVNGVYAYDILNPHTQKFLYQHRKLKSPGSLVTDKMNFIYVCDWNSNRIHQLTDSGQLVTIHTVLSSPSKIFYDDQHGLLYTTTRKSNVITLYRLVYVPQSDIPIEILNMDDRSIQLFKEALKDGKETVHSIRIMVVGHSGVGKTTLVKRLLRKEVNISERCSTEGTDVYVNCCNVSLSTHEWTRRTRVSSLPSNLQDKKLSERQLGRLSMKIGQKYLLLGLELGLSWVDIQQIQNKYPHIATQCLVSLVKWKQENEDGATFKTLEKAFQLVDIDVDILKSISTAGEPMENEDIVSLMPLHLKDKKLTEGQLDELSKNIGQEFLLLALELELSWVDIQQIQQDYSHTHTDCCRAVLVKWLQQSYDSATFRNLEKAFQFVGIDVNILKSIGTGIPLEILNMDYNSIQSFKEALEAGKEKVFNIRVMVVGQYGVGKTTLVKRLLGETVNISDRCSTDGIDVHVHCCDVSLMTKEWTRQKKDSELYSRLNRLVKFFSENVQKPKVKVQQEGQSRMDKKHDDGHHADTSLRQAISQSVPSTKEIKRSSPPPPIMQIHLSSDKVDERPVEGSGQKETSAEIQLSESKSDKREDALLEILQLVNVNSDKLEKSSVEHAALAMWDFAGQYIFYTTHQMFLTSRAIYLLVIDLSQEVTDLIKDDECFLDSEGKKMCKVHDLVEIWLNSIHSIAPSNQAGIPPVILVGTHVDKIPEKSRQNVIFEYFIKIRQMLKNKPILLHLMDNIEIDNNQCDPRLEDLKRRIFELASQQHHWGEEQPARWLPLEQAIMTLKASGVKVAPLSLIEEINRSASVKIEDRNELEVFLNFQHKIGTILYFSVEGLREKIVLDPQWMIDALKSLITAEMFIMKNPGITTLWFNFKEEGKLTHDLIDAVWSKELNPEFHTNKEHLLLLMEKLNIIARPISYSEDGKEVKVEDYFLSPCMLSQKTPIEVISPAPNLQMKSSSVLCFVFREKFLPPSIFHRILAACLAHWEIFKKEGKYQIFCGSCVFKLDPCHKLILHFREYVIFARVTKLSNKNKTPDLKLCIKVRKFIESNLSKIIGMCQNLKFELYIQCLKSEANCLDSIFPVSELQNNEEYACSFHDPEHAVESQDLLKSWFEEKGSEGEKGQETDKKGQKRRLSREQDTPAAEGILSDSKGQVDDGLLEVVREDSASPESMVFIMRKNEDGDRTQEVMGSKEEIEPVTPETSTQLEQKNDSVDEITSRVTNLTTSEECLKHMQTKALPPGKKYHAFFSYSSTDMQWVKQTVERLEKDHGFVCCEYDRNNTPGTPLLKFAADSIRNAYKTVVVMTREAFQSGFVLREVDMAITHGIDEKRECVVPVLLEECEIPLHLRILNYVDVRDAKKINIWLPVLVKELET